MLTERFAAAGSFLCDADPDVVLARLAALGAEWRDSKVHPVLRKYGLDPLTISTPHPHGFRFSLQFGARNVYEYVVEGVCSVEAGSTTLAFSATVSNSFTTRWRVWVALYAPFGIAAGVLTDVPWLFVVLGPVIPALMLSAACLGLVEQRAPLFLEAVRDLLARAATSAGDGPEQPGT